MSTPIGALCAPHLDAETRAYWEGRALRLGGGASRCSRATSTATACSAASSASATARRALYGVDPREMLQARTLAGAARDLRQRAGAACSTSALVRWALDRPCRCYGLGIPPAQYEALAGARRRHGRGPARTASSGSTCDFSLDDNYFAWQAFGRGYAPERRGPLPPYLRRENFDAIRERAGRVEVLQPFLHRVSRRAARIGRVDRYVLLDAQDWMTDAQLNALWREITRTARPGARVIFRTAAEPSLLPGRVEAPVLGRWRYEAELSRDLAARDRSAIYGGFHLYALEGLTGDDDAPHDRASMDRIYRRQRHVYDLTRKYYLLGRDRLIARAQSRRRRPRAGDRLRHRAQPDPGGAPLSPTRVSTASTSRRDADAGARGDRARRHGLAHPRRAGRRHGRSIRAGCSARALSIASSSPTRSR